MTDHLPEEALPCPHCPDGHRDPLSKPWSVFVDESRLDNQPVFLRVARPAGEHVSESDAEWLWTLLHGLVAGTLTVTASDWRPLGEDVTMHTMLGFHNHFEPDGVRRTCMYHSRLGKWTFDGTKECLLPHPDPFAPRTRDGGDQ